MTELDDRLTAALQEEAPERDPLFRVELLMRLERARFRRRVFLTIGVACMAAALAALNVRAIEDWVAADVSRIAIVAIVAAVAMFPLAGVPLKATPVTRTVARLLERWL